ncbi:MAG: N-acyl homoserine lactonase family protein [Cryobacterium sp.]|nr:N-acyl homoserine lactonase family protein [Cryobacterium sp.]MBX3089464.1 N-acyl homoserine lactonase family protein [Cryobacterium sp.]MCO5294728.1 N-acyl homoserine lactonase family protein [Homoserinimonas sp.]MCW5944229.1 N-acyl homoserine lactonase family protein [Cryobacterium sp.]
MNDTKPITVTPIKVGELRAVEMPIYVHVVDHPAGRILVDTGLAELHPLIEDMQPIIEPLDQQGFDLDSVYIVVNTHLHFDHCGGNRLFPKARIFVQQQELDDARTQPDYTIPEWIDPPSHKLNYVPVDGDVELLPGVRLLSTPGHTRGSQVVAVETLDGEVIIAGDTAVWSGELDEPQSEGQRRIVSLRPSFVWLSHQSEPYVPASAVTPGS